MTCIHCINLNMSDDKQTEIQVENSLTVVAVRLQDLANNLAIQGGMGGRGHWFTVTI